jgi:hypothetical protein
MLNVRAVWQSSYWENFQTYRFKQEQTRLHPTVRSSKTMCQPRSLRSFQNRLPCRKGGLRPSKDGGIDLLLLQSDSEVAVL